jgi:DNA-binding winged helix-turn-helix (wHTH) protein
MPASSQYDDQVRPRAVHRFGEILFDPKSAEILAQGRRHRLRPMAAQALEMLIEKRGAIVTRDELRSALWNDRYVEWETGIHQVIRQIRRALDEDARHPQWLETVPRRGYRLKCEVDSSVLGPDISHDHRPRGLRRDAMLIGLGTLVPPVLLIVICLLLAGR